MSEFISGNAGIIRKSDVFCLEIERPSVVDKYQDYRVEAIYYVGEVRYNIYFYDELSYFITEKITLDDEPEIDVDEVYLPIEKHGNGKVRDIIKYFAKKENLENELKTNKNIYAVNSVKINEFTFVNLTDYTKKNWKIK